MKPVTIIAGPATTFLRQYAAILSLQPVAKTVVLLTCGLVVGWWAYVPVHELLHAAGCLISGGEVTRLEIQPVYAGALLARVIPFVSPGGDYAGRLSGFDIRGSDWTYFVTIYFPYLLTLGGLWLAEVGVARRSGFLFGFSLPCALAPLVSLSGDFLEIGSLGLYQVWPGMGGIHRELISDDLFRLLRALAVGDAGMSLNAHSGWFIGLSLALGGVAAWATLIAADRIRALGLPVAHGGTAVKNRTES